MKALDIDFFKIENTKVARQGRILISEPFLNDTYFRRSVVLLTEHSKEGSVGFVLNKPVELTISDVLKDFPDIDASISIGGPVNTNTIHYIHTVGDIIPQSIKVLKDLYWGGDFETIKALILKGKISGKDIRFFQGYSGWSPKQIDNELSMNSWLITELDAETIMKSNDLKLWQETLHKVGDKYRLWINFPENPGEN